MGAQKDQFIELCMAAEALRFGEFILKSGRASPYFFNAGQFNRGALLHDFAAHYARLIAEKISGDFMLFGPAYKGIPLAVATALQLAGAYGIDVGYAFNRKEAKAHGEGGEMVGAELRGDVIIVDDVITAGTAIGQSVAAIRDAGANPKAVVIAFDREEIATESGKLSAVQMVQKEHGIPVHSIINLGDLIDYLQRQKTAEDFSDKIRAYRKKYGVAES